MFYQLNMTPTEPLDGWQWQGSHYRRQSKYSVSIIRHCFMLLVRFHPLLQQIIMVLRKMHGLGLCIVSTPCTFYESTMLPWQYDSSIFGICGWQWFRRIFSIGKYTGNFLKWYDSVSKASSNSDRKLPGLASALKGSTTYKSALVSFSIVSSRTTSGIQLSSGTFA